MSKIQDLSEEDRPREKFLQKGKHTLTDAELLAILLGSGYKNVSAVDLARLILQKANNDLHQLGRLSAQELTKIKGIGQAKALTIAACLELGRRRKEQERTQQTQIKCSNDIFEYARHAFQDLTHEEFRILLLNQANKVIQNELISKGGVAGTVADPRIILKNAILYQASALILMHNHPSGNLKPSEADQQLTTRIKLACALFDVRLLDHVIFADEKYFSFADEGLI